MEPSVRSSSYRASECKLKKTETSLHETVQRFVESLSDDTRISQYADINYAIKKFESRKWYWLNPSGRSGYLVCLPKMPIVWIDEQFKFSYKIRARVSSHIYEKVSVFIAFAISFAIAVGFINQELFERGLGLITSYFAIFLLFTNSNGFE